MKISMLVKCEKCGYENFPQHRFCGMCAAELALPTAPSVRPSPASSPAPQPPVRRPVSEPAPIRLEREPVDPRSVSYLLEDEPEPSHWGRYVWLILLVGGLVAGGWYWRADLVSLAERLMSGSAGANAQPNASAPEAAGSPSDTTPANSVSPSGQAVPRTAGSGQASDQTTQAQTPPVSAAGSASTGDAAQSSQADQSKPSDQAQPGDVAPAAAAVTRPTPPAVMTADDLAAQGEKYLYGNGVPENCGLARKNLIAAAQRSNATAQNVLGTMYATGHCATRDLPTAYRWFSRSLRKDPSNTRIEQDLKVLWNQMTPEERKLALRDQR